MRYANVTAAAAVCLLFCVFAAAPASAATVHVTSMADSGPGTLRNAIATAPAGSTIVVPAGTIKLTSTELSITKKLEIDGAGPSATTVSGNDAHRVFSLTGASGVKIAKLGIVHGRVAGITVPLSGAAVLIDAASSLTLNAVRVTNNLADASGDATHPGGVISGGAISNSGGLALVGSVVDQNTARADATAGNHGGGVVEGGAVDNKGTLSIGGTSISANVASANGHGTTSSGGGIIHGAAVDNESGNLVITGSALDRNVANADSGSASGGGIIDAAGVVNGGGSLTLTRTSVSGNKASAVGHGAGGGIVDGVAVDHGGSDLSIVRGTIDANTARADGDSGGGIIDGGAIIHGGNKLTIDRTSVSNNTASAAATGAASGGIINSAGLDDGSSSPNVTAISNSRFGGNSAATGTGGSAIGVGLYLGSYQVNMSATTVDGNRGTALGHGANAGGSLQGAGIYSAVPTAMTNVTVSGNSLDARGGSSGGAGGSAQGGGVFATDTLTVLNSTLAENSVSASGTPPGLARGGNVAHNVAVTHAKNTIVSGGHGDANFQNCRESLGSDGHNIDSLDQCGFHGTGDQIHKNPQLGPLQDNGGPVPTRALLANSPAINKGDNTGCPSTDARGFHRPAFGICDIGAFEVNPDHPPSIAIVTPAGGAHYKQGAKVIANYSCSDPDGSADLILCGGPVPNGKPIDTSTPGKHTFTVQASDLAGKSVKKTVHYTVDTTESSPPTVGGFPPDQGCVPSKLKLKISVHPRRLRRAAVFLDGKQIATSKKPNFKVTISGSQLSPGRHQIKILREYKSGTKRRSTVSFTRCRNGGRSPHIHTEGTPDRGSCTAKRFTMNVSITRVDVKTILVKLDGKKFAKPGKPKFKLSIDVRKLKAGAHKLIIRASDKFKNGSVSITDFVRC